MQKWRGGVAVLLVLFVVWAFSIAATGLNKERCRNMAAETKYVSGSCLALGSKGWVKI